MLHLDCSLSSWLRLDYVSCALTVLSTLLVGRKHWAGLVVAAFNSLLICAIGWRTAQFGFIPANLFCIAIYCFSFRSWRREPARPQPAADEALQAPSFSNAMNEAQ